MYELFVVILVVMLLFHILSSHLLKKHVKACKLIWFFRPGCGHCTRMNPAWDEFVKQAPSEVEVVKINTQENPDMARDFEVEGVPHIVKVTDNVRVVYRGDRTAAGFLKFVME